MSRRMLAALFVAPVLCLAGYLLARGLLSESGQKFLYRENGPIELGTAMLFALAAGGAISLVLKTGGKIHNAYRVLFLLFAVGCGFVALEEVSYGQQLFGWRSPDWFEQNNHHGQTNLHNLFGNRPSHILKNTANYATLVGFVIVPIVAMLRRGAYRPGHWTYFLLPRGELILIAGIAQLCSVLWDLPKSMLGEYWHQGWNEVRELYWGMAAFGYIAVMRGRLIGIAPLTDRMSAPVSATQSTTPSRQAA